MQLLLQAFGAEDAMTFLLAGLMLAILGGVGFRIWRRSRANLAAVVDIPTFTVGSARPGYVKLRGRQYPLEDKPLAAPLTGRDCTWWWYNVHERKGRHDTWRIVESGSSPHLIRLEDGTGEVIVNPSGAEVLAEDSERWYGSTRRPDSGPQLRGSRLFSRYRYTECIMRPGEPLYAIGRFETRGGDSGPSEGRRGVAEVLKQWKADHEKLVERFDTDGDGAIDVQEWERAREAARRMVAGEGPEPGAETAVNILEKPLDERPFLLSPKSDEELRKQLHRRYLGRVGVLVVYGALLGALLWILFRA